MTLMQISHLDSITIKKIHNFASMKVNINDYLSKYTLQEFQTEFGFKNLGKQPNKNDLVNTLLSVEFKQWIDSKLEERQQYIITKRRFIVDVFRS